MVCWRFNAIAVATLRHIHGENILRDRVPPHLSPRTHGIWCKGPILTQTPRGNNLIEGSLESNKMKDIHSHKQEYLHTELYRIVNEELLN